MRSIVLKKLLNGTLAFSVLASGFVVPSPKAYAQVVQEAENQQQTEFLSVDFSQYPTLAEGWEAKADKKPYSGGVTSSKSLKLNKDGYYLKTPVFGLKEEATLSFSTKGYSATGEGDSVLKVKAAINGEWQELHTLTSFETSFVQTEVLVPKEATQLQIVLEKRGAFNVALDGVKLTGVGSIVEGGDQLPDAPETDKPEQGEPDQGVNPPANDETQKPEVDAYGELVVSGASSLEVGMTSTVQTTTKEGDIVSDVKYESTNPDVLTIDDSGKIQALKEGITQIGAVAIINDKKYVGQKRLEVTTATDYPITVFEEVFKEFPTLQEGWQTNLSADDKYSGGNEAGPALKLTKQGQFVETSEFRLIGNGLLKFAAKGNASQASGTTVLRVQYQSNFKDEWKNLAMFNSFSSKFESFGVRIPEDATRLRIFVEEKGKMNIAFDDMRLFAQELGEKEADTIAPVIEMIDEVTSGNLDEEVIIKANVTDNRKVGKVTLYYRVVGETEFKTIPMGLTNGVYQGIIGTQELSAQGIEYYIQATDVEGNEATTDLMTISISAEDYTKPTITSISPADQANVGKNKTPKISAKYSDRSGVDVDSVQLIVNGEDVTKAATVSETEVVYQVEQALENGTHTVQLTLADLAGNELVKEWSFKVSDVERQLFFGQLHSHTNLSDGAGTIDDAYTHAREVAGVDFLAVTDHSNSFDNDTQANIADGSMSEKWQTGLNAADKYNDQYGRV